MGAVGFLFSVVLIYNLNFFLKKKAAVVPEKAQSATPSAGRTRPGGPPAAPSLTVPRDKEKWKRDPFQYKGQYSGRPSGEKGFEGEPAVPGKKKASIRLQGITVRDGRRYALVNGWVVAAGDRLDDILITDITPDSIFVRGPDGVREIDIYTDISDKEK
jgi:hypothetical protein